MSSRTSPSPAMNFENSKQLRKRAHEIIPAGAHTYSKGDDQFPELAPGFLARGKGSRVWDVDGNEFVDWGMGLRSVILGHAHPYVLDAVKTQLELGANFTRPHPIESQVAEQLIELIPSAEMVKFAKNGSDVTTAAVKLARAFTGRDIVARCQEHPFFSVNDWFIGDTPVNAGVPKAVQELTKRFAFNDAASLEKLFAEFPNQIAAVILEAAATEEPKDGFLEKVKELCAKNGTVFILDEMITGFRWHLRGAQTYYNVIPDLATFGKAFANGFAVSALVGRREIMELGGLHHSGERVFLLSTTHGGETHALAAAQANMEFMKKHDVAGHGWQVGKALVEGFNEAAKQRGLQQSAQALGVHCSPYILFKDSNGAVSMPLRTLFLQEMIKCGVLIPYIAPAWSHSSEDVEITVEAFGRALDVVAKAVESGTTDGLLVGPVVKPVFRRYN